jgi:hypothetical protein
MDGRNNQYNPQDTKVSAMIGETEEIDAGKRCGWTRVGRGEGARRETSLVIYAACEFFVTYNLERLIDAIDEDLVLGW